MKLFNNKKGCDDTTIVFVAWIILLIFFSVIIGNLEKEHQQLEEKDDDCLVVPNCHTQKQMTVEEYCIKNGFEGYDYTIGKCYIYERRYG